MQERKEWYNNPFDEDNRTHYYWVDFGHTITAPQKPKKWYNLTPTQWTRLSDCTKAIAIIAYTIFIISLVIGQ